MSATPASHPRSSCRRSSRRRERRRRRPAQVWDVGGASVGALGDRFSPSGYQRLLARPHDRQRETQPDDADSERFISVVGFGRLAVQATRIGLGRGRVPADPLNVFVGMFNLVPLLPFDGGHIAIATYEKIASTIRRRPVQADVAKLLPITAVVMAVLAFIFLSSLFLDITPPDRQPVLGCRMPRRRHPPVDGRDRCPSAATRRSRSSR